MSKINEKEKYKSIYQLVNLPDKRHLNESQQLFERTNLSAQEQKFISPQITNDRNQVIKRIESETQIYSNSSYEFKFPVSKFPEVPAGQRNNLSYQQKISIEDEDTFQKSLTPQQIAQIKQTGHFHVKSKLFGTAVPYVWKINGCIFKGVERRAAIWLAGLGNIYNIMDFALQVFDRMVPKSLLQLAKMPIKLFNLIFGKKKLTPIYRCQYNRQIAKDFWTDIMENQLKDIKQQISHEFLQLFYLYHEPINYERKKENLQIQLQPSKQSLQTYNKNKQHINSLKLWLRGKQDSFQANWVKIRKNVLNKISTQVDEDNVILHMSQSLLDKDNHEQHMLGKKIKQYQIPDESKQKDQIIMQKFYQEKYLIYTAHLRESMQKNDKLSKTAVQALLNLITIFHIIYSKMRTKDQRLRNIQQKVRSNIYKNNPIRSQNEKFVQHKFSKQYTPIKTAINEQFLTSLSNDKNLSKFLTPTYQSIYRKYVQFVKNHDKLLKQKQQSIPILYEPQRIFRTTYILFPPYEIIQTYNNYSKKIDYSLKKKQEIKCDTSTHFWKCKLYGMRLKSWTINCFKFLVGVLWASPLGIRCLFGFDNFQYDQQINYQTGVKSSVTRPTVLGMFGKILRGIKKSRANFQAQPDRGIFGKNLSRVCNIIQCYFFRLIIVGLIGVIMLYPVAIILFSILCLIGVLTSWIWVPLCMFITYLFNILIFQFQVGNTPNGCLIRSVPFIGLVLNILYHLARILGSILFLVVIAPILCLLYFIWIVLQRLGRTLSDAFMICFFSCCGRTPSRDTSMARKVSGPGMSRNYFYSIAQNNVYILTQCALQKIVLYKYAELTRKQIRKNVQKHNAVCQYIFKPFGFNRPIPKKDYINTNNNELTVNFERRYNQYIARYPNYPRMVRFTQDQIEQYFPNCVKIVKNFVTKQKIEDWIFEDKKIIFQDYEELTRNLWMQIFQCGQQIFQPLQRIDSRFKLIDDENPQNQMQQKVDTIMRALQGQVELIHKKIQFTPAKRSLIQKDNIIFSYISMIINFHDSNSEIAINVNQSDPCSIFVPHRNLNELKQNDTINRQKTAIGKYHVIQEV